MLNIFNFIMMFCNFYFLNNLSLITKDIVKEIKSDKKITILEFKASESICNKLLIRIKQIKFASDISNKNFLILFNIILFFN